MKNFITYIKEKIAHFRTSKRYQYEYSHSNECFLTFCIQNKMAQDNYNRIVQYAASRPYQEMYYFQNE